MSELEILKRELALLGKIRLELELIDDECEEGLDAILKAVIKLKEHLD